MQTFTITEVEAGEITLGVVALDCYTSGNVGVLRSGGCMSPTEGEPLVFIVPACIFLHLIRDAPGVDIGAPPGAAPVALPGHAA